MPMHEPSCEDDSDPNSLELGDAVARILATVMPVDGHERLHLRAAHGRVLYRDIPAPLDVPHHDNSAMDGYAVRARDIVADGETCLRVIGTALAGHPFEGVVGCGEAIRIMTGAALPAGADSVVMQEQVAVAGQEIRLDAPVTPGRHVRRAGEDLARGQCALAAGTRLGAAELGLVASLGIGEVDVTRRVRVACFSTGDELRSIGEPLARGEIFDSNRYTLYGLLREAGAEIIDLGVVRDDRGALERALREAAAVADVVVTSGGVSVGDADYVRDILTAIGKVDFWKVAMKPGRPLAFGTIGKAHFFGLPGNPVSVMVTFRQFVLPALIRMSGASPRPPLELTARTTVTLRKRPGRLEFQRGMLARDADGELVVTPTGEQGSGILRSMALADCLIVLGIDCAGVAAGAPVTVQLLSSAS